METYFLLCKISFTKTEMDQGHRIASIQQSFPLDFPRKCFGNQWLFTSETIKYKSSVMWIYSGVRVKNSYQVSKTEVWWINESSWIKLIFTSALPCIRVTRISGLPAWNTSKRMQSFRFRFSFNSAAAEQKAFSGDLDPLNVCWQQK